MSTSGSSITIPSFRRCGSRESVSSRRGSLTTPHEVGKGGYVSGGVLSPVRKRSHERGGTLSPLPAGRTVAQDLLSYVRRTWVEESIVVKDSDGGSRQVPKLLLVARSQVFETMLDSNKFKEAQDKTVVLSEPKDLVDLFINALVNDRCELLDRLKDEASSPSLVEISPTQSARDLFAPVLGVGNFDIDQNDLMTQSTSLMPRLHQTLATVLDLLAMAVKYNFENLRLMIEEALVTSDRLWCEPACVLAVMRICASGTLGDSVTVETRCKSALQNMRGGDMLAWLMGHPLSFWQKTRHAHVVITHSTIGAYLCSVAVSMTDTVYYVKLYLSEKKHEELHRALRPSSPRLQPSNIQLWHQRVLLDGKKTLQECQLAEGAVLCVKLAVSLKRRRPMSRMPVPQAPFSARGCGIPTGL